MIKKTMVISEAPIDLGSAGELLMQGITVPGIDLSAVDESSHIRIGIKDAAPVAIEIMKIWGLSQQNMASLLGVPTSTIRRYAKGCAPGRVAQREGILDILLIHKALQVLIPGSQSQNPHWILKPNDYFDGQSAYDFMVENGTSKIRQYVEAELNG